MKLLDLLNLFVTPIMIYGYGFGGWEFTTSSRVLMCVLLSGSFISSLKSIIEE